jgi:hypothetical protein
MRTLVLVALLLLTACPVRAEVPPQPNDLCIGVGDPGLIYAVFDVADVLGTIFTFGQVQYGETQGGFAITGSYQRSLNRWLSLGGSASWAGSRKPVYIGGNPVGYSDRWLLTQLVEVRGHWHRGSRVDVYSGLAFGLGEVGDRLTGYPADNSKSGFAAHTVPLGLRFGGPWGGYVQTGIGFQSFIQAGLSRRY